MPSIFRFASRRSFKTAAVLILTSATSLACGPDFPNRYLDTSDALLLAAPAAIFAEEVTRVVGGLTVKNRAIPTTRVEVLAVDVRELREALRASGRGEPGIGEIVERYAQARTTVELSDSSGRENLRYSMLFTEVPAEFFAYLDGAAAWRVGQWARAQVIWADLLRLPESERRHRTTWADFMIGRAWEQQLKTFEGEARVAAANQARTWFRRTREDAATGFADSLGLAVASLGREARVELLSGNHCLAINLYAAQLAAGDETAVNSLLSSASAAIAPGGAELAELAHDPVARGVVTALLLSRARGMDEDATNPLNVALANWATALRGANVGDAAQADRLAWLAYRAGHYALAERWLALAPADAPVADWIRAKLALRAGDLRVAEALLARVSQEGRLDEEQRKLALAELGRTRLALDDRTGALTAWLDGGHWEDAAYLGEQVMSLDEVRAYVDLHCPANVSAGERDWRDHDPQKVRGYLRFLLARRMAREDQASAAVDYYPPGLREEFTAYLEAARIGFDLERAAEERAHAFWQAAQTMREHGLDLWATELDPDWAISGANFARGVAAADRARRTQKFGPTSDERARLEKHPAWSSRFSYRYRAAELAWWAASLLPNDSDETAHILVEAGSWLKARDPRAAERFYQALVIRCGHTSLGRAAVRARWFPPSESKVEESDGTTVRTLSGP